MLSYMHTLNLIKMALLHKSVFIKIKATKKNKYILDFLMRVNLIQGIFVLDKLTYKVYLNHRSKKKMFVICKVNVSYNIKIKFFYKLKHLKAKNNVFLLSSKGIISLAQAFIDKVGGIILFKLV